MTVLVALLPRIASGQESPTGAGGVLLGGSVAVSSLSDDEDRQTTLQADPRVMFFVVPGLAMGADVPITFQDYGGQSVSAIGIGPRIAYFFGGPEAKAYPFIGVNGGFTQYRWDLGGSSESDSQTYFGGFGGAVWMLRHNVGVSTEVYYARQEMNDITLNDVGLMMGFSVFLY